MGLFFNVATGERVLLRANHIFGRSQGRSDTCISAADVSSMHAVVRWRDSAWAIADFSRNGTRVDGDALQQGEWLVLRRNQDVCFGRCPGSIWRVQDLSAPGPALVSNDPQRAPILLTRSQLLPDTEAPELALFQNGAGEWVLDKNGEHRTLGAGDTFSVGGETYRLMLSERIDETAQAPELYNASPPHLIFDVSDNEEHVRLQVRVGPDLVELGERSHHYCLLTLARLRLLDAQAGSATTEHGWCNCDELAAMLRIELAYLNIQIHRARQQLMSSAPAAAELCNLVERRRGELRLGELSFEIRRGTLTQDRYRPSTAQSRPDVMSRIAAASS
ncbi:MAG: FHA domain-containing protein [Polyangiaceae bacterium]